MTIERAAGGLVIRGSKGKREVLLIDDAYGKVSFPKGHLEAGETWEEAAVREVAEETRIKAKIVAPLGRVEYPISRDGKPIRKQVRLFLLQAEDEAAEPIHQVEEVNGAYYAPFDEAKAKHDASGYANWSFIFDKAAAVLAWHDGDFENAWRKLSSETDEADVDALFAQVEPTVAELLAACRQELAITMPELTLPPVTDMALPLQDPVSVDDVRGAVEHTLLKPEASLVEIENLCIEASEHRFPLVCINPQYVSHAAQLLKDSQTAVCTVIGFPLGASTPENLAFEAMEMAAKGAREIDMVIPVGAMREDDVRTVYKHVAAVVRTAKGLNPVPEIKVILETSALTFDQVIKAGLVCVAAGADYIKTSTGFHKGGATLADVSAMAMVAGNTARVKASGGVRTPVAARNMLRYGAARLGTSSGVNLVR